LTKKYGDQQRKIRIQAIQKTRLEFPASSLTGNWTSKNLISPIMAILTIKKARKRRANQRPSMGESPAK
jgi:hypothetical protein